MNKPYTVVTGKHYIAHLCKVGGVDYVDIFNKTYKTHIARHVFKNAGQIYCRAKLSKYDNAPKFENAK